MKLAKYLKWILLGISAILLVVFFLLPHNTTSDPMVDTYIIWAYVLVAIALVLVLFFLLLDVSKSKKSLITFIALIVGAVVLVAACWLLAPGGDVATNVAYTPKVSKFTDAALYVTYAMVAASICAIIWSAISNAIKNR
ncbi:MAG: hypothetical protein IIU16_05315 [Bacteroidales bacterium]|nr:hypothetical protein [Bacteroidales bacterium]